MMVGLQDSWQFPNIGDPKIDPNIPGGPQKGTPNFGKPPCKAWLRGVSSKV